MAKGRVKTGLENVLVITDIFSKYTVVIHTRDQRATTVLIERWFLYFGHLHSHQGRNFESALISELSKIQNTEEQDSSMAT